MTRWACHGWDPQRFVRDANEWLCHVWFICRALLVPLWLFLSCSQLSLEMGMRVVGQSARLSVTASAQFSIKIGMDFHGPTRMIYNHFCQPFILCHHLVRISPLSNTCGNDTAFQKAALPCFYNIAFSSILFTSLHLRSSGTFLVILALLMLLNYFLFTLCCRTLLLGAHMTWAQSVQGQSNEFGSMCL